MHKVKPNPTLITSGGLRLQHTLQFYWISKGHLPPSGFLFSLYFNSPIGFKPNPIPLLQQTVLDHACRLHLGSVIGFSSVFRRLHLSRSFCLPHMETPPMESNALVSIEMEPEYFETPMNDVDTPPAKHRKKKSILVSLVNMSLLVVFADLGEEFRFVKLDTLSFMEHSFALAGPDVLMGA
ncbi:hypothetical protein L1987_31168 [Smallanthus sonchifolius]|uniref:Uncharacterized protein n=1 Tax=Smallanthus sonchifolius TaxID=185202 RepID=A0ACB9I699_9ASTR|nr:hypothetical protein L1987_31168 [Smallanthus sonchifolius]